MKKTLTRNLLGGLILVLTIWGVVHIFRTSVNPGQVWNLLRDFPVPGFLLLILIASVMMAVRSYRFYLLLNDGDITLTLWQAVKIYVAGQAFSPLPAGEGVRGLLIKIETKTDIEDSVPPLILLGVTETIVAVLITLAGSISLGILRLASVLTLIAALGLVILLINYKAVRALFSHLPKKKPLQKAGKQIVATQKEVHSSIFKRQSWIPSREFVINLALAFVTDLVGGAIIFTLAQYYTLPLSAWQCLYIFAAATVLGELVPFAPGGVGATEGGMAGILLLSGIALPQALALVLMYRVVTLVYGVLIGLIFAALFYAKALWQKPKKS